MNLEIKQAEKLYKALQNLLHNSVDNTGSPKKATAKQLTKAISALNDYEKFIKNYKL